jgi:hypothetical protein
MAIPYPWCENTVGDEGILSGAKGDGLEINTCLRLIIRMQDKIVTQIQYISRNGGKIQTYVVHTIQTQLHSYI